MVSEEELVGRLQNDPQLETKVNEEDGLIGANKAQEGECMVNEEDGHTGAKAQEGESRDLKENKTEEPVSTPMEGRKRGRPGGLNKVCNVSPELQAIVGQATMPRTQIVKQLWMYIRANNLQDPSNKRNIICNDALRLVFDTDATDMFQMNKLLARHIWAIDSANDDSEPNAKKVANVNAAGLVSRVPISEFLASFLGTSETEMSHEEVVKHLWDYIRENKLQLLQMQDSVRWPTPTEDAVDLYLLGEAKPIGGAELNRQLESHATLAMSSIYVIK
ncbi:hypothetical protein KI387_028993, partial [Taxus chinensis]